MNARAGVTRTEGSMTRNAEQSILTWHPSTAIARRLGIGRASVYSVLGKPQVVAALSSTQQLTLPPATQTSDRPLQLVCYPARNQPNGLAM